MKIEAKGKDYWKIAKSAADKVGLKERDFDTYLQLHKKRHLEYRTFASELGLLSSEQGENLKEVKILANRVREFLEIESIFEAAERAQELKAKNTNLHEKLRKSEDLLQKNETQLDEANKEVRRLRKALKLIGSDICTEEDKEFIVERALKGE